MQKSLSPSSSLRNARVLPQSTESPASASLPQAQEQSATVSPPGAQVSPIALSTHRKGRQQRTLLDLIPRVPIANASTVRMLEQLAYPVKYTAAPSTDIDSSLEVLSIVEEMVGQLLHVFKSASLDSGERRRFGVALQNRSIQWNEACKKLKRWPELKSHRVVWKIIRSWPAFNDEQGFEPR